MLQNADFAIDFIMFTKNIYEKMQFINNILSFVYLRLIINFILTSYGRSTRIRRRVDHVIFILENLTGASRLASGCTIDPRECMSFIGNEFTLWLACLSEAHPRNCNRSKNVTNTTIRIKSWVRWLLFDIDTNSVKYLIT